MFVAARPRHTPPARVQGRPIPVRELGSSPRCGPRRAGVRAARWPGATRRPLGPSELGTTRPWCRIQLGHHQLRRALNSLLPVVDIRLARPSALEQPVHRETQGGATRGAVLKARQKHNRDCLRRGGSNAIISEERRRSVPERLRCTWFPPAVDGNGAAGSAGRLREGPAQAQTEDPGDVR